MLPYQSAIRAFIILAAHHRRAYPQELLFSGDQGDPEGTLLKLFHSVDLEARILRGCALSQVPSLGAAFPLLSRKPSGQWMIVVGVEKDEAGAFSAFVLDLEDEEKGVVKTPFEELAPHWDSVVLLCGEKKVEQSKEEPFGFTWFLTEIAKYKRHFRDVAIAAFVGSQIAIVTPLLFNIIIDKIIPHKSYHSLTAIVVVFVLAALFEALFTVLRQSLTLLTTNKIDATFNTRVFDRLLRLPMDFFERTPTGITFRNLQQTEKVRHFLTGRLFDTLLQLINLPVLLILLMSYSVPLSALVIGFSLLIGGYIALMVPIFRSQIDSLNQAEGLRQALSNETIHGMRTVKSLCLEDSKRKAWESRVVTSVRKAGGVAQFGIISGSISTFLEKIMQFSILGLGALEVFNDHITVGAMVAFSMLANRVSQPLLQIVGLVNEYQETALAVKMLGSIMNHPLERDAEFRGTKPPIVGRLEFDQVSFRYPGAATQALDRLSFTVEPGQVIGVVGRSGSGKTTVTRLLQGIQLPTEGIIKLDGVDLRQIDLHHLRRNVGIVLQESFLFSGTIRANIAASNPDASTEEIIQAARLAGAEEFIDQLPLGYETRLEEGATNLSGGQRQRIAIARALLPQPKLLIFDEATSALDPESENIIQNNLAEIAKGRTMVVVSHRLSSLVNSDKIMVLQRGKLADIAPHSVLLERCEIYASLWNQQTHNMR